MSQPITELAEREIEILRHIANGLSNGDIAERTGLSLHTIKWYLKQIFSKLYVTNRTQAAAKARELGLLKDVKRTTTTMQVVPSAMTPIFGRSDELARLYAHLVHPPVRLITVQGVGGIGKTRLVNEAAHQAAALFGDGVAYVALANLSASASVLAAIAQAVRVPVDNPAALPHLLRSYLRQKHVLIVLDNFEHLAAQAADLSDLLAATQHVKMLVTSREVLHLRGEVVLRLEGLPVPNPSMASHNAAFDLFVYRARAARPEFTPDAAETAEIAAICRLVDGLPLALELAAGWFNVFGVREIRQRIEDSLDMLTSHDRDRAERHRSIRSVFDASLAMLPATQQEFLLRLSVFHDSFTVEAAEAVAGVPPQLLGVLLDQALVQRTSGGRFDFHTLLHQYLEQRRRDRPELDREARHRYAEYYLTFARTRCDALLQTADLRLLLALHEEREPLAKAWKLAVVEGYTDLLTGAASLSYYYDMATLWLEGAQLLDYALTRITAGDHRLLRGRLCAARAINANRLTDIPTLARLAQESWPLLKDTAYEIEAADAMVSYAAALVYGGAPETVVAPILADVELSLKADGGRNRYAYIAISVLTCFILLRSDPPRAIADLEALMRDWPPEATWLRDTVRVQLAELYLDAQQVEKARALLTLAVASARARGELVSYLAALYGLHMVGEEAGEVEPLLYETYDIARQVGGHIPCVNVLRSMATYMLQRQKTTAACRIFIWTALALDYWNERDLLFDLLLQAAESLAGKDDETSGQLLSILLASADCPPHILEQAAQDPGRLTRLQTPIDGPVGLTRALAALYRG
ncbi:MAG: AAA family ATPase [Chloroflexi bacterium]|nr:AAA family ATPase [Chloroflexota bacterium]